MPKIWILFPTKTHVSVREKVFSNTNAFFDYCHDKLKTDHLYEEGFFRDGKKYGIFMDGMKYPTDTRVNKVATKFLGKITSLWKTTPVTGTYIIAKFERNEDTGEILKFYDMDITIKEFIEIFNEILG